MPIQILPARLANQIAAGEVVERPASVVKELIENSLDADATQIEIDIDKGGAKCIRIKDNGNGVCKDQLTLALSRHATSKISNLDDLEAIVSLGFRGEALASVSSVSRLTFTSKPATQEQAWQAIAEGRDMQVQIQPAAHPQGTTVEVLDLFFNTPARRRFLKTEKTEFQHIDELVRRIALSRFEITFVLKHNGKIIRQYRAAQTQIQKEKRLAAICSDSFVKGALHFQNSDNDLHISGWICDSISARSLADVQYCYINGRVIRDKLINHAIRQVYAYSLPEGKFPAYVIYIRCEPAQVDVNVHPSKHEVRFHQARWVHDFIVSTLSETLSQSASSENVPLRPAAGKKTEHDYLPLQQNGSASEARYSKEPLFSNGSASYGNYAKTNLDPAQIDAYCDFVREAHQPIFESEHKHKDHAALGTFVSLIADDYGLLKLNPEQQLLNGTSPLLVLSLNRADAVVKQTQLFSAWSNGEVIAQPLLLPVRIQLTADLLQISSDFQQLFERLGFAFKIQANKLIISKVPAILRQMPVAKILPILLAYLGAVDKNMSGPQVNDFCAFLVKTSKQTVVDKKHWTLQNASLLLDLFVNLFPDDLKNQQEFLFNDPDLTLLLQGFSDE
ncbi:DNA mismatch repair endonuclease MutL [Psychromonas antarctica]|uniref:DNA mismatch repair endonuclease MutL n=1 Tax=Psychromonas antarctica TaxID=67573 RepID=UPI001EE83CED|nr:DNA mismatch repair endonuclease MutL [Psychromonas antarctica]MCG6201113.1 DNA mismatch repair endonuclease MutL [Psychromonas antarctica]